MRGATVNKDPDSVSSGPDSADDPDKATRPAGLEKDDPTDTDHPTGQQQAAENAATESPS